MVGQVSLLSMPARSVTPKKDAPVQNKATQTELINPALQFDTTEEEAWVSFNRIFKI